MSVFAEQAVNPEQETELVIEWLRDPLLRHRTEPAVIDLAIRLLNDARLTAERGTALVEAMFTYRPDDWYPTPEQDDAERPAPPDPASLDDEALAQLERFADAVLQNASVTSAAKALARDWRG